MLIAKIIIGIVAFCVIAAIVIAINTEKYMDKHREHQNGSHDS